MAHATCGWRDCKVTPSCIFDISSKQRSNIETANSLACRIKLFKIYYSFSCFCADKYTLSKIGQQLLLKSHKHLIRVSNKL